MEDMLAKEVEQLLARQAELATNLAQVRREKELLEGENDMLYAEADNTPMRMVSERGGGCIRVSNPVYLFHAALTLFHALFIPYTLNAVDP